MRVGSVQQISSTSSVCGDNPQRSYARGSRFAIDSTIPNRDQSGDGLAGGGRRAVKIPIYGRFHCRRRAPGSLLHSAPVSTLN